MWGGGGCGANLGVVINAAAAACDPAQRRCFPARPQHHSALRQAAGRQAQASASRSTHIFSQRARDPRVWTEPPIGERRSRDHDSNSENTVPRRRLKGNLFPPIDSRESAPSSRGSPPKGGRGGTGTQTRAGKVGSSERR